MYFCVFILKVFPHISFLGIDTEEFVCWFLDVLINCDMLELAFHFILFYKLTYQLGSKTMKINVCVIAVIFYSLIKGSWLIWLQFGV